MADDTPIQLSRPGDVRFTCPECGWGVTLTPEGAAMWTEDGKIKPFCTKCQRELIGRIIQ